MTCPDTETFQLAIQLHEKLRYLRETSEDQQDLVGLLDDFIQEERIRIFNQGMNQYVSFCSCFRSRSCPELLMMTLTQKEQELLLLIEEGMDEPGCGWLHELIDVTSSVKGVLGSLVKKNLVRTFNEDGCSWVQLVD